MYSVILHKLKKLKKPKIFSTRSFFTLTLLINLTSSSTILPFSINEKVTQANKLIANNSFITTAIEIAGPSVVTIDTVRYLETNQSNENPSSLLDPYFEKLFGKEFPYEAEPRIEEGQGSGFIFEDGLVMTNAHVVSDSDRLIIGLADGRKVEGKVIGLDLLTDLAVIELEGDGPWPKAILGNSDNIKVGDWAIAVGNPFGLENTVTLGIISNIKRDVSELGLYDLKVHLIQTDAAINPGNSGGPLINASGEVIGINTLIREGPGAGLGFAIPINEAKEIAYELINNGMVIHPMIGISLLEEPSADMTRTEVKVGYVVPDSPADRSGIKINDVIVKINEQVINNASDVIDAISENGIYSEARIIIKRNDKLLNFQVKPIDIRDL